MKIGQFENKAAVPTTPIERKSGPASHAGAAPGAAASAEPSATVALSSAASQLTVAAGDSAGAFDAAKVARISDAIRDGKFSVNAEAIADKLIANAQELLGRAGRG